ncbi:MAG: TetR/AcrR family transcriptional regulator [Phascolarctobacterium sp.]|nr:TetR/AcrR family transcriptional regulator [Phascolarctobacterium sp.]
MDRRQLKTRQAIFDAFVELMAKYSYEKISVKDIIDAANIGRSTFYAHFETKDDLARKMCLMLFKHIFSHTIPPCSTHNFSELPQNAENRIAHILYHLRDKRKYYWGIITYDDGNLFLRFFREYIQANLRIVLQGSEASFIKAIPEEFIASYIASSFVGMVRWWLKENMKHTPEEVAKYYISLINPAIAEFESLENNIPHRKI